MNADVKIFLESGMLEEYLLGIAEEEQIPVIERYIRKYPEVKAEYEAMQAAMEQMTLEHGIPAPDGTKEAIMVDIDRMSKNRTATVLLPQRNLWAVAASLVALVFALSTLHLWNQSNDFENENNLLTAELAAQTLTMQQQQEACQATENQLRLLADPNTAKLLLQGNQKAPDLKIAAYWNEQSQQSFLSLTSLPELPGKKCFQIWADVDGEMVSLGMLPNQPNEVVSIPFKLNAESLNVTIEPEGGSEHPTVSDLVASVAI